MVKVILIVISMLLVDSMAFDSQLWKKHEGIRIKTPFEVKNLGLIRCSLLCLHDANCVAFNFAKTSKLSDNSTCELVGVGWDDGGLERSSLYDFYADEDSCQSNPCEKPTDCRKPTTYFELDFNHVCCNAYKNMKVKKNSSYNLKIEPYPTRIEKDTVEFCKLMCNNDENCNFAVFDMHGGKFKCNLYSVKFDSSNVEEYNDNFLIVKLSNCFSGGPKNVIT